MGEATIRPSFGLSEDPCIQVVRFKKAQGIINGIKNVSYVIYDLAAAVSRDGCKKSKDDI